MAVDPFEHIVQDYRERVVRYLAGILDDAALAHDLAQETFIRVHQSMDGLREECACAPWIFRIAHNLAIDRIRSRSSREEVVTSSLDAPEAVSDAIVDCGCVSAENRLGEAEMTACMHSYIRQMPPPMRECLILRDLEGLSEQAVADILGCSVNVVKVRTYRARRQLRATLSKACGFYQDERGVLRCEPVEAFNLKQGA